MDKNTLIALLLIGAVLLLWPMYMKTVVGTQEPVLQEEPADMEMEAEIPAVSETGPAEKDLTPTDVFRTPQSGSPLRTVSVNEKVHADTLFIRTNRIRAALSSLGGGTLVGWELLDYFQQPEKPGDSENRVQMIPEEAQGNLGIAFGVDFSGLVFDMKADTLGREKSVRFTASLKNGGRLEKIYTFYPDAYHCELIVKIVGMSRSRLGDHYVINWNSGLASSESVRSRKNELMYYEAFALQGGEILKTKEKGTGFREGITDWAAIRTKYFIGAVIPREPSASGAELEGTKIKLEEEEWKRFQLKLAMPFSGAAEEIHRFDIYLGPLDYHEVRAMEAGLEKTMNFGWTLIKPFSIAFFYTLEFLERYLGNYGWAIIVFSIIIKVLLYPLTRKSFQSMRQMQELQPKIKALQEKHKKDPQRLNQETMKLYKQHGVNPMGGCLPLLLQMPVLFALFNLFRTTIMLRQASFLGVIHDLSAPDSMIGNINVLPILMGATMIIQQKLSSQDPKQKAMAYMMPIFMLFIFYNLSAGLNLYYLMFNVLTISQELIMKRKK